MICVAEIVGVHGVKGILKLKVFSETPENLMGYMPLCDAAGNRKYDFLTLLPHKNIYLATLKGLKDRTAAEKMRGTKLYIPRDSLPDIEDEGTYYHADLIGMTAKSPEGETLGRIISVANFGAGDLLEIKPVKGASYYLPFTDAIVPHVDLKAKEATVVIPPGLLD